MKALKNQLIWNIKMILIIITKKKLMEEIKNSICYLLVLMVYIVLKIQIQMEELVKILLKAQKALWLLHQKIIMQYLISI